MKSHIRVTKKEIARAQEICDKAAVNSIIRYGWIMAIALNEVCGLGETRILRVLERANELSREYDRYRKDGVEEEILMRRVKQVIPCVERLYPE